MKIKIQKSKPSPYVDVLTHYYIELDSDFGDIEAGPLTSEKINALAEELYKDEIEAEDADGILVI